MASSFKDPRTVIECFHHFEVGNDCPVSVVAASLRPDHRGKKRVVSGRGLTEDEALQRCVFEAVERHSSIFRPDAACETATASALGAGALEPASSLLISQKQYESRAAWNQSVDHMHCLPAPFDPTRPIRWVKADHVGKPGAIWVPAALCFLGYEDALQEGFPVPDSSGLAFGKTREDAIASALYELVERDAVSIWWYNRLPVPALKIETEKIRFWSGYCKWVEGCDRNFWLLDLTSDLRVPVAAAITCNAQGCDLSIGFAAGPTAEAAATGAMTELVQFEISKRLYKHNEAASHPDLMSWCKSANVSQHLFCQQSDSAAAVETTIEPIVRRLSQAGLNMFALDLPLPAVTGCVVRVMVPGLRPIWPRFAPGRVYDVPHRLGRIPKPFSETELNPVAMLY